MVIVENFNANFLFELFIIIENTCIIYAVLGYVV